MNGPIATVTRPIRNREQLKEVPNLEVRASDEDIKRFVAGEIYRLPKTIRSNEELKDLVQNSIAEAVDGMFLLARLYVDSLRDKKTETKVKAALQKISRSSKEEPAKLYDDAYDETLKRIEGQLPEDRKTAKKVLSCITYARIQLTTKELCHALAVDLGELEEEEDFLGGEETATICAGLVAEDLDKGNIPDIEDIVSVCAGLVIVDDKSNVIRLIHYTTQEYFERTRERWFPFAQLKIASTCLIYLSFNTFRSGRCRSDELESRVEQMALLRYASIFWGYHIRTVQEQMSKLASSFLQNAYLVSSAAQASGLSEQITGMHLTADYGLLKLSEILLLHSDGNRGMSANLKDRLGQTPFSRAAKQGHKAVVELLLTRSDVDPDVKNTEGQTPLSLAAEYGHEAVVELLLARSDIDPDSKDDGGATPLSWAAEYGREGTVQLLLDTNRTDPNSENDLGLTLLSLAAMYGHENVVQQLLAREDIDPNLPPLWWAAQSRDEAMVRLRDAWEEAHFTELPIEEEEKHEAIVKLLLLHLSRSKDRQDIPADTPKPSAM